MCAIDLNRKNTILKFFHFLLQEIKGIVFPNLCLHCGEPVKVNSDGFCPHCVLKYPVYQPQVRFVGDWIHWSLMPFHPRSRLLIHQLKYRGWVGGLRKYLQGSLPFEEKTVVWVPVPLHWRRKRERGYNQASYLARACAQEWGGVVDEKLLKRTGFKGSQTKLGRRGRQENVRGLFQCIKPCVGEVQIVLVDDVCTTGATLLSCAETLEKAGYQSIHLFSLIRAEEEGEIEGN